MAEHEFELVSGSKFRHIKVFVNRIVYRNFHSHSAFELLFVLSGRGRIRFADDVAVLSPGTLILINPDEAHEISSDENGVTVLIFQIVRRFCESYLPDLKETRFTVRDLTAAVTDAAKLRSLQSVMLEAALVYLQEPADYAYRFLALTAELLYRLKALPQTQISTREQASRHRQMERIYRILDYLDRNYTNPVRLKDIADQEGLSVTYVSHLFTEQFGIRFQEYLNRLRFEHALSLMASQHVSASEAALRSGFSAPKYFTRMLRGDSAPHIHYNARGARPLRIAVGTGSVAGALETYLPGGEAIRAVETACAAQAAHAHAGLF